MALKGSRFFFGFSAHIFLKNTHHNFAEEEMRLEGKSVIVGIKTALLFVGTIIGAGFASGREILAFFAGSTLSMALSVLAAGALFYFTGLLFFNLGRRVKTGRMFEVTGVLLKKYGAAFNFFLAFCYLILFAAMLAGADALFRESLGYGGRFPFLSLPMLGAAIYVTRKGLKGLLNVNSVLVPIVVAFIIAACALSLSALRGSASDSWELISSKGVIHSLFNATLYVAMNMLLSSPIIISSGREMTVRQAKVASGTAAAIITALLALMLTAMRLNYSEIQGMEMPMVALAAKSMPLLGALSALVLSFAIFTTLISSLYPLREYMAGFFKNEVALYAFLSVTAFLFSRMGSSYIITYIYPIQGIIGVMFIAFVACFEAQTPRLALKRVKKNPALQ